MPQAYDSLELTDEKINAITDKIPQRPVGVVEGTSYSLIIAAAFGVRHTRGGSAAGRLHISSSGGLGLGRGLHASGSLLQGLPSDRIPLLAASN